MERPRSDDDQELHLPALDGDSDDDQGSLPTDDEDLDLDASADGEQIDLDASTSNGDFFDLSELIGAAESSEAEKWTEQSDVADDLAGAEGDLVGGEENGWTEDNEPPDGEDWGLNGTESVRPADSMEDGGEEGLEERCLDEEQDDATALPPLDMSEKEDESNEEEEEAFGRQLLDEMTGRRDIQEESDDE